MKIKKLAIKGSPFIGVFCKTTQSVTLVPFGLTSKEEHTISDILGTELVPCSLANSSLLGVLAVGNHKGFVVPSIVEKNEVQALQENGISVTRLPGVAALGNLVSLNDSTGLCSPVLSDAIIEQIEKELNVSIIKMRVGNSELVGSACVLSNRGFVCTPHVTKIELSKIQKATRLKGNRTSANFGDPFVGNGILANDSGALVGSPSTAHELLAIEEAFRGEA